MPDNYDIIRKDYLQSVAHAFVAYQYFANSIPQDHLFCNEREVQVGRFMFKNKNDAHSMYVELGWAFFPRFVAAFEVFAERLRQKGANLPRDISSIIKCLEEDGHPIPDEIRDGLCIYRELRNTILHGDGDPAFLRKKPRYLNTSSDSEPHIYEHHIRKFYNLFVWLGNIVVQSYSRDLFS